MSADEEEEEGRSHYERYRILVQNECAGGLSFCQSHCRIVCLSVRLSVNLTVQLSVSFCLVVLRHISL